MFSPPSASRTRPIRALAPAKMSILEAAFQETGDDLASLTRLDEDILLEQLRQRYERDQIYVRASWGMLKP